MNRKIIGILVCMLFLTTGFASATGQINIHNEKNIEEPIGNKLFVFGRMEQLDFAGSSIDFEVISFVFIKDGKEIYKLNNGEIIRFYAPMIGLLINKILIGYFSSWEILE